MRRLAPCLLAATLAACDDPAPATSEPTLCGEGDATLEIGVGHPFAPMPEPPVVPVERGLQGGFHILVSLRVVGAFDGDHGDVALELFDGERPLSNHRNTDVPFTADASLTGCSYDQARLVMLDEDGGLMTEDAVLALVGRTVELAATLTSDAGDAEGRFRFTLGALQ